MRAVLKRELQGLFYTPVGYVFLFVYFALGGVYFYIGNLTARSSAILDFFAQMYYVWMLLAPILTMRMLAGERKQKTDQLLLTSPVSMTGIVVGKYLAALVMLGITGLLMALYAVIVNIYGKVYGSELLVGYLGYFFQGAAIIAFDLMVSGQAKNSVSAALFAFGANLVLWMADLLNEAVSLPIITDIISFISLYGRYEGFMYGQLSYSSLFFYCSLIFVCLLVTVKTLDARRFSEA